MSNLDTIVQDKSFNAVTDSVRQQYNLLVADSAYFNNNRLVAATIATLPGCARGTTASKAKTVATTIVLVGTSIVPYVSLTATDDLWALTSDAANTLAAGFCRRYQLCWDGTSGTTVVSVRPSNDQSIATLGTAALALAACRWPSLPPNGTVIIGILSIANTTNAFIPATTLLSATGVTDTYRDGADAACRMASIISP